MPSPSPVRPWHGEQKMSNRSRPRAIARSEEHTSELQSQSNIVCRLLLEKKNISTSTLPSIKLRKCSSKIITSILSFISGRLATKSNQIKQLIRNGRSASLQRTFKKSFTSFSHSTRNKTRDGLIRVSFFLNLKGTLNTTIFPPHSTLLG